MIYDVSSTKEFFINTSMQVLIWFYLEMGRKEVPNEVLFEIYSKQFG